MKDFRCHPDEVEIAGTSRQTETEKNEFPCRKIAVRPPPFWLIITQDNPFRWMLMFHLILPSLSMGDEGELKNYFQSLRSATLCRVEGVKFPGNIATRDWRKSSLPVPSDSEQKR
jgi:hypothetical protein